MIVKQILHVSTLGSVQKTVRRKCTLLLGYKDVTFWGELISTTSIQVITQEQSLQICQNNLTLLTMWHRCWGRVYGNMMCKTKRLYYLATARSSISPLWPYHSRSQFPDRLSHRRTTPSRHPVYIRGVAASHFNRTIPP